MGDAGHGQHVALQTRHESGRAPVRGHHIAADPRVHHHEGAGAGFLQTAAQLMGPGAVGAEGRRSALGDGVADGDDDGGGRRRPLGQHGRDDALPSQKRRVIGGRGVARSDPHGAEPDGGPRFLRQVGADCQLRIGRDGHGQRIAEREAAGRDGRMGRAAKLQGARGLAFQARLGAADDERAFAQFIAEPDAHRRRRRRHQQILAQSDVGQQRLGAVGGGLVPPGHGRSQPGRNPDLGRCDSGRPQRHAQTDNERRQGPRRSAS
ncbi:hypothetical protein D3C87_1248240 [compost metagenome]